ncbi:hypothetical protein TYRP_015893 [Tyrophagus putrescentiae]|nr:hypothetical protein TYRP_015893 [Tyrophagus putrescentiae]
MVDDDGGVLVDSVAASTVGLVQQQAAVQVMLTKKELYSSSSSSSSDKNDENDDDDVPVFQSLEPVAVKGVPPPPMPTPLQDETAANTQNFVQQHPAASVPSFKSIFSLAVNSQPIGF